MVHAGVVPQWDVATALACAGELEAALHERDTREFLAAMFGNTPARWSDALAGDDRLRFTLNTLTRTRFVAADGTLEFTTKDGAGAAPPGHFAWFDAPGRRTAGVPIAFGHWSALGLIDRPDVLSLDTGCVWGGRLTAVRIDDGRRDRAQVECAPGQKPRARASARASSA
jgi:bis(5'-nucleosyl)-tetraphosphatase (symmetrical)